MSAVMLRALGAFRTVMLALGHVLAHILLVLAQILLVGALVLSVGTQIRAVILQVRLVLRYVSALGARRCTVAAPYVLAQLAPVLTQVRLILANVAAVLAHIAPILAQVAPILPHVLPVLANVARLVARRCGRALSVGAAHREKRSDGGEVSKLLHHVRTPKVDGTLHSTLNARKRNQRIVSSCDLQRTDGGLSSSAQRPLFCGKRSFNRSLAAAGLASPSDTARP